MPQVVFSQTLATIENKTANYQNVTIIRRHNFYPKMLELILISGKYQYFSINCQLSVCI